MFRHCNGVPDCLNGEDENDCPSNPTLNVETKPQLEGEAQEKFQYLPQYQGEVPEYNSQGFEVEDYDYGEDEDEEIHRYDTDDYEEEYEDEDDAMNNPWN